MQRIGDDPFGPRTNARTEFDRLVDDKDRNVEKLCRRALESQQYFRRGFHVTINDYANWATALGIPIAIFGFSINKHIERRDRRRAMYSELDQKYRDFMALALQYPTLGVHDWRHLKETQLTEDEKAQQMILVEILGSFMRSLFEAHDKGRSYTLRRIPSVDFGGWSKWFEYQACSPIFRAYWRERNDEYGKRFRLYMSLTIREQTGDPIPIEG
ncbi:MAG: hypothetical protein RIS41_843 [Actinomycetota bacterium]|jgi:hypothetical protein